MGRPAEFDEATRAAVIKAVAAGNTRRDAAWYAGIGERTLYTWLAKGREEKKGRYRQFRQALKKAEASAAVRNVAIIQKAAQKSWQAAAWWLERRRLEDWALAAGKVRELQDLVKGLEKSIAGRGATVAESGT